MNELFWDLPELANIWSEFLRPGLLKLLAAAAIFFIGRLLVLWSVKLVTGLMTQARVDQVLTQFLGTLLSVLLLMVVIIAALSQLGLDTTSVIAVLGAAGLAIGLALQDTLSHFAAGTMLIMFRPFKVGDELEVCLEAGNVVGRVQSISMFNTQLLTADHRQVVVPNGLILANTLINRSSQPTRRLDLRLCVPYETNLQPMKNVLLQSITKESRVLPTPAVEVVVDALGDQSVVLAIRLWVATEQYEAVRFDLIAAIKGDLDQQGLTIMTLD